MGEYMFIVDGVGGAEGFLSACLWESCTCVSKCKCTYFVVGGVDGVSGVGGVDGVTGEVVFVGVYVWENCTE